MFDPAGAARAHAAGRRSYSSDPRDDVSDEAGVAADMLVFLQEFLEAHPEHAHRPFYITGTRPVRRARLQSGRPAR